MIGSRLRWGSWVRIMIHELRDMKRYVFGFVVYDRDEPLMLIEWGKTPEDIKATQLSLNRSVHIHYKLYDSSNKEFKDVLRFLTTRVVPSTRIGLDELLKDAGLKVWSPLQISRISHGVMYEDFIWIKFDGEEDLTYDDIRVR